MGRPKKYHTNEERKAAVNAMSRANYAANLEKSRAYSRAKYAKGGETIKERNKLWARKNRELFRGEINEQTRKRREANPEYYREKERQWYANSREKILARRRNNHALEVKCRTMVNNYIRDGKLQRQNCQVCKDIYGIDTIGDAHHTDYNKPLEIIWVCKTHHAAFHSVFIPSNGHSERKEENGSQI